jgi:hypothetical protein
MRKHSLRAARIMAGVVIAGAAGCVTAPASQSALLRQQGAAVSEPPRSGAPSDILTASELVSPGVMTVGDGVRRLRPEFVRPTIVPGNPAGAAVSPVVYINGGYAGSLDVLDRILLEEVEDIRFIRAWQARGWWGPSCPCSAGVIHVRTRRGG